MKGSSLNVVQALQSKLGLRNRIGKEFLAEFLGTFILIALGTGAVAQKVLTGATINDYFALVWGYALGVGIGVLVSGSVSGGHINPAVTLAMALWGRLPWPKVPVYMVAQYTGSFTASAVVYGVYKSALRNFESVPSLTTAGIWATYPGAMVSSNGTAINNFLTSGNGFGDQVIGTMFLLIGVCAIVDQKNTKMPGWFGPLWVAFIVMSIGLSFGFNCGWAINPARDLSPRIFTLLAGWGDLPFKATTVDGVAWWWIPILAPHIGAVLGMLVYTIFIEMHHEVPQDESSRLQSKHDIVIQNSVGVLAIKQLKEAY